MFSFSKDCQTLAKSMESKQRTMEKRYIKRSEQVHDSISVGVKELEERRAAFKKKYGDLFNPRNK